jgi:hypothetical protein
MDVKASLGFVSRWVCGALGIADGQNEVLRVVVVPTKYIYEARRGSATHSSGSLSARNNTRRTDTSRSNTNGGMVAGSRENYLNCTRANTVSRSFRTTQPWKS